MNYSVKEIYYTLQGEGARSGQAAVFLRFAGCNLWNGSEADRPSALCNFCDTDFVGTDGPGGGKFLIADALALAVAQTWAGPADAERWVVCTGGEPLLQLDEGLIAELQTQGFRVAVETNGTIACPPGIDWVCVSPKPGTNIVQQSGDELKFIYPQPGFDPEPFSDWEFTHFFLQPLDGPHLAENTRLAAEFCLRHPQWRLSLQIHKIVGLR